MSSRIFQSVILQMKDATRRCFGVADDQGNVIASSDLSMMGYTIDEIRAAAAEPSGELFSAGGRTCRVLTVANKHSFRIFGNVNDFHSIRVSGEHAADDIIERFVLVVHDG